MDFQSNPKYGPACLWNEDWPLDAVWKITYFRDRRLAKFTKPLIIYHGKSSKKDQDEERIEVKDC